MQRLKAIVEKVKSQKTPLTLAVVAQASTIAIWLTQEGKTGFPVLNFVIAAIAAFSIDLIIVSTAFSEKRSIAAWILALATSVIALIFSAAIAIFTFNDTEHLTLWSVLHAAFPILVFFYSWFLSINLHDKEQYVLQLEQKAREEKELERLRKFESIPIKIHEYRAILIRKLLVRNMNASQIYEIIGGMRNQVLDQIREIQVELGIPDTDALEPSNT